MMYTNNEIHRPLTKGKIAHEFYSQDTKVNHQVMELEFEVMDELANDALKSASVTATFG